ncbi:MAG: ATP-binding cassette domain-containing protein [Scrofimicrobium sp.]
MSPAIHCSEISKRYGKNYALRDVTVDFGEGVTAILGANGAGKTTLLSILATLTRPTSGFVRVSGTETRSRKGTEEARRHVGYLPQRFSILPNASVRENVEYSAWVHGVSTGEASAAATDALHKTDLLSLSGKTAKTLSGGQKQRLGIACAIAHRPSVLLLDEPTVGLDPLQRIGLRKLIVQLGHDATVILSTHLIEDVAEVAGRTVVLKLGTLVFNGTTLALAQNSTSATEDATLTDAIEQAMLGLMK